MSTQDLNIAERNLPEWLDPFPEPQTMPRGWNLDSIVPGLDSPAIEQAEDSPENPSH